MMVAWMVDVTVGDLAEKLAVGWVVSMVEQKVVLSASY